MYGATANLVGIRYRHATGEKWAEPGSRNGFFLSLSVMNRRQRSLVLVEGATDLATILSLGIPGVGLSSASHPVDEILLLVRRFQTESVALLLDSDKAGRQAAQRIGATLFPHVSFLRDVLLPPGIKDVREWRHHSGLTTQQFLEHVRSTGPVRAEVL
jgi:DNA primase